MFLYNSHLHPVNHPTVPINKNSYKPPHQPQPHLNSVNRTSDNKHQYYNIFQPQSQTHNNKPPKDSVQNTPTMPAAPKSFLPAFAGFMGTPPPTPPSLLSQQALLTQHLSPRLFIHLRRRHTRRRRHGQRTHTVAEPARQRAQRAEWGRDNDGCC